MDGKRKEIGEIMEKEQKQLERTGLRRWIVFAGGILVILGLLFFYNNKRIFGHYEWGFFQKENFYNWIPFRDFHRVIEFLLLRSLQKTLFFAGIGTLLALSLSAIQKLRLLPYLIFSLLIMLFTDFLAAFTGSWVSIDVNNWLFYSLGLFIGAGCFFLIRHFLSRVHLHIHFSYDNTDSN